MTALIGLVLLTAASSPDADALPAAAPEDPKPPVLHRWTGAVSLGASIADGNTEKRTVSATADAEYRREKDRTSLNFLWNYTDEEGDVTERRVLGGAKYDYFLSKKAYLYGAGSGEYNAEAALDLRATLGAGAGYQFIEDADLKFSGEGGLAYVDEDYVGSADDTEYLAARLAYKGEWKPDEKWTLSQASEIFPSLEDKDDVYAKVDTRARLALTEKMFAQGQYLFTWDNTPAAGAQRDDHLVILTLGWSF